MDSWHSLNQNIPSARASPRSCPLSSTRDALHWTSLPCTVDISSLYRTAYTLSSTHSTAYTLSPTLCPLPPFLTYARSWLLNGVAHSPHKKIKQVHASHMDQTNTTATKTNSSSQIWIPMSRAYTNCRLKMDSHISSLRRGGEKIKAGTGYKEKMRERKRETKSTKAEKKVQSTLSITDTIKDTQENKPTSNPSVRQDYPPPPVPFPKPLQFTHTTTHASNSPNKSSHHCR